MRLGIFIVAFVGAFEMTLYGSLAYVLLCVGWLAGVVFGIKAADREGLSVGRP